MLQQPRDSPDRTRRLRPSETAPKPLYPGARRRREIAHLLREQKEERRGKRRRGNGADSYNSCNTGPKAQSGRGASDLTVSPRPSGTVAARRIRGFGADSGTARLANGRTVGHDRHAERGVGKPDRASPGSHGPRETPLEQLRRCEWPSGTRAASLPRPSWKGRTSTTAWQEPFIAWP